MNLVHMLQIFQRICRNVTLPDIREPQMFDAVIEENPHPGLNAIVLFLLLLPEMDETGNERR